MRSLSNSKTTTRRRRKSSMVKSESDLIARCSASPPPVALVRVLVGAETTSSTLTTFVAGNYSLRMATKTTTADDSPIFSPPLLVKIRQQPSNFSASTMQNGATTQDEAAKPWYKSRAFRAYAALLVVALLLIATCAALVAYLSDAYFRRHEKTAAAQTLLLLDDQRPPLPPSWPSLLTRLLFGATLLRRRSKRRRRLSSPPPPRHRHDSVISSGRASVAASSSRWSLASSLNSLTPNTNTTTATLVDAHAAAAEMLRGLKPPRTRQANALDVRGTQAGNCRGRGRRRARRLLDDARFKDRLRRLNEDPAGGGKGGRSPIEILAEWRQAALQQSATTRFNLAAAVVSATPPTTTDESSLDSRSRSLGSSQRSYRVLSGDSERRAIVATASVATSPARSTHHAATSSLPNLFVDNESSQHTAAETTNGNFNEREPLVDPPSPPQKPPTDAARRRAAKMLASVFADTNHHDAAADTELRIFSS